MQRSVSRAGYLERIQEDLARLERAQLRRVVREQSDYADGVMLDFSSNDYLGLSDHPEVVGALRRAVRAGSGGARLLAGAHASHRALENDLASLVGRERALLFSSGYHAALGAVGSLARVVQRTVSDELNHASLIDALRLTRLPRTIYPHASLPPPSGTQSALIVTESLFGVDGDAADPAAMLGVIGPDDVLLIDEAHALGVAGPHGGGLAYGIDDPRIVVMGTLSKAIGAHGGFIAGPAPVIDYLESTARTFIFDTALPPALAEAARAGVRLARDADEPRRHLAHLGAQLRRELRSLGFEVGGTMGAIVPILIGDVESTLEVAARLRARGINAPPIRPPTVPPGTSRLRVTLKATHTESDVRQLVAALAESRRS